MDARSIARQPVEGLDGASAGLVAAFGVIDLNLGRVNFREQLVARYPLS
jgi:hypothetical protein